MSDGYVLCKTSFNQDIANRDDAQGAYFDIMFNVATSFNQDIINWDASQGTDFSYMFYLATSFDQDFSQ